MAPRRRFDKKNATTFSVVHRSHDDELYFDNDASRHVLVPVGGKQKPTKANTLSELEATLGDEAQSVRDNEGLAAQYGIYYDDSKYDYMQHLKPIGQSEDAVFIAKKDTPKPKPKQQDLMELLKDQLPSETGKKVTQADMENIPRELQGFKPNMDPRLRETLEALEDEAYIEDGEDDDDFFNDILKSGTAADIPEEEYDEWDMDNYQDEFDQYDSDNQDRTPYEVGDLERHELPYNEGEAPETAKNVVLNTAWEKDFERFKQTHHNSDDSDDSDDDFEDDFEENDQLPELKELPQMARVKKSGTKLRKKKGAMTDTSSFSMSSSAVFRSEGLTLLDDRFEKLAKDFEKDEAPEEYQEFRMEDERNDFEDMLDDFLDNYELEKGGRKLMKKNDEMKRLQKASDDASNTKVSRRRKEQEPSLVNQFAKVTL
ncbi:Protein ltv1 [Yamadazyma tenuis]|uniref:Low temperature viability protein n=1 Tax=Candida tenuis (strain ATCC 10573 / BCRC 21748 / CBS 615 / JCM 9827 / NBRC 10315 / NRRL Y-1498 / VKM Y-70) TaxID=590646 RepID=G3B700_CANTC|nr:uncharacterized protein CANTEDRAFT_122786 [Yamadazyma tenuis ATCC 10573]EGV63062.1 hypothetical protein CANTEDRAFT_122786 [Yamadazyma tenuis ATCC 10573]WEJ97122.1 Protein ltv1 [Yamadazyma tenuis]